MELLGELRAGVLIAGFQSITLFGILMWATVRTKSACGKIEWQKVLQFCTIAVIVVGTTLLETFPEIRSWTSWIE